MHYENNEDTKCVHLVFKNCKVSLGNFPNITRKKLFYMSSHANIFRSAILIQNFFSMPAMPDFLNKKAELNAALL